MCSCYLKVLLLRTLTVESAFPDTSMFFLSSIPLVRDWWPAEESTTVPSLCHHTSWLTNLSECGYTAHYLHSILLLKYPVNHLLCEYHQTANKKNNHHYSNSEQTCLMVKHNQLQLLYLEDAHVHLRLRSTNWKPVKCTHAKIVYVSK